MLDPLAAAGHPFPFPVADCPFDRSTRDCLLPGRLTAPWLLAQALDSLIDSLDLSCLAALYHGTGSAAFHPVLMLKLALFCLAEGSSSPAHWADMAARDGPTRWLVCGIQPSLSACYSFRDRLGDDCLLDLNRQALALAQQHRLSPCTAASLDGSLIDAAASRHHLVNSQSIEAGLQALEPPPAAPAAPPAPPALAAPPGQADPAAPAPAPAQGDSTQPLAAPDSTADSAAAGAGAGKAKRRPVRPGRTQAGRKRQTQRWRRAQQELKRRKARNAEKRKSKRADAAKMVISPTDPEAATGRDKRGVFRPLYNIQLMADLDSDLIVGYDALAQQNDSGLLGTMLDRAESLLGHALEQGLVDGSYVGGADLAQAEDRGVEILGPIAAEAKTGQLPKSAFSYDAESDSYTCPEGQTLEKVSQSKQKRSSVELVVLATYQNKEGACQQCPRKQECSPKSKSGRTISRSEHEGSVERLKQRMSQAENKKRYKRRAATVERLFGDAKENRGMSRANGRGLDCVRIQLGLFVLQHNLRALAQALVANKDRPVSQDPAT